MADAAHVVECDYVGIVSANDVPDKLAKAGFHTTKSEFVDAPLIDELPMVLECRLISYDEESCRLVGEIVNVSADERILNANGKIDPRHYHHFRGPLHDKGFLAQPVMVGVSSGGRTGTHCIRSGE